VRTVVSLGATVTQWGPWFGQFQLRYFGPRPLIEDNRQQSKGTTLAYLRTGYKLNASTKVSLDIFNLFSRKASDIDYYYVSRLQGEPADGVGDIRATACASASERGSLSSACLSMVKVGSTSRLRRSAATARKMSQTLPNEL